MSDRPSPPGLLWLAAFCFFYCCCVEGARIESISAAVDRKLKHETFVPLVAFRCGHRNKFMNQSGDWQDDASTAAVCLDGKLDILKYCKRVYPNKKITNIVEYSHISHIPRWCNENGRNCKQSFYVRPYRCIEGEFIADSLQVPTKCKFGHASGRETCDDYQHWSKKAESQCTKDEQAHKSMRLHSFSMLEPCGLSLFRGVEYVCCPRDVEAEYMDAKVNEYLATEDKEDEEDDDEENDDDDDDDEDSMDDEDSKSKSADDDHEQDPYFEEQPSANEHERYHEAQERLEKKYRAKVTKVITEWSELFERYNKMKTKDPEGAEHYKTEMTARFRKTVSSLEDENREMRHQLEEIHDERVQAALNEKKRKATHEYRLALAIQVGHINKQNVLRTLKDYIRAEEKDRAHMLNRYRHLLHSSTDGAASFEPMLLHRLRYIDLRINGTLAMLRDFPELERQIRPAAEEYWRSYRRENTPEVDGKLLEVDSNQPDSNEKLVELYKEAAGKKSSTTRVQNTFKEIMKSSEHKIAESKTKFVPLKDILVDKEKSKTKSVPEDSDEEQFEEDQDDDDDDENAEEEKEENQDQQIQTSPIVQNETSAAEHLAAQQRAAKIQHAHKLAQEQGRELSPHKQHLDAIKAFDLSKAKPVAEEDEEDSDEEEDSITKKKAEEEEEEEQDDEEDDEIYIEPDKLYVHKEVEPSYAKHDRLMAEGIEPYEHDSSTFWSGQTTLLVYVTLVLCVLAVAAIVLRSRHSRQGFIEVDVCNPDDHHVNKLQGNGYENPTYFYDSKP